MSLEALSRNGHNLQLGEFECAGLYQIPVIQPVPAAEKVRWIPFNSARTDALRGAHGVHFFIDDYLFERCWNDPVRHAKLLSEFRAVLSPDFSLFTDYPPAVQIYNHWRKHLLAAFWQRMGLQVIPSICWSDESSFDWCFDGEPISAAIALKADATTVGALKQRVEAAEQKVTPQAITSAVTSSALYAYEKYAGRNYCLTSGNTHTFVDNRYRNPNGTMTNYTGWNMSVSEELFAHSGNGANIRISFDIKRTNVNTSASSTANVYTGIWVYYRYFDTDGTTVKTTGRGWYLRSTDANFVATDGDWVRMQYGPLSLTSFHPTSIAYFTLGTGGSNGMTGTVQFRNIKLEVLDRWTAWSAAPEDLYGMVSRMVNAESRITQNANNIALKVSTSTYNTEKVYRGSTAPTTLYANMLWLDTSATPNLLKRYTGSAWVAAGAQEVKSSGIYIGPNNVAITTENFLLQLLDPANNENVLMEMSANGNVGFKQLYADEVVSNSVASAYGGPIALHVNTSYSGASDTYFRSLGDAVKAVNNRFLRSDVYIYLPNGTGEIYEPAGTKIQGVSGPGKLIIYGYANSRLNSFISVKGCSAHICFQNVSSTIQVQQMVVRDEQDIRSLAVEIATLTRRQQRGKGLRMA